MQTCLQKYSSSGLLQVLAGEGARLCIVGAAGSPSCGVLTTSRGHRGGLSGAAEHARA
jgi:predicted secreted protein